MINYGVVFRVTEAQPYTQRRPGVCVPCFLNNKGVLRMGDGSKMHLFGSRLSAEMAIEKTVGSPPYLFGKKRDYRIIKIGSTEDGI